MQIAVRWSGLDDADGLPDELAALTAGWRMRPHEIFTTGDRILTRGLERSHWATGTALELGVIYFVLTAAVPFACCSQGHAAGTLSR